MRGQKQVVIALGLMIAVVAGLAGCESFSDRQGSPTTPANTQVADLTNFSATEEGAINYGYGVAYTEGFDHFLLNVPAGDFLMTYTTDLGVFPTFIRASNDSLLTLYLMEDDILHEVVIYEGITGGMKPVAQQQFFTHSGPVLFRHLTWEQYDSIMANFLVMVGPVTVFANDEVVAGEYNEELTEEQIDDVFGRRNVVLFSGGGTSGYLGGRFGADWQCRKQNPGFDYVHAFISVNSSDEIRDMPGNYGVPRDRPILSLKGLQIAENFGDLLDGHIDLSLMNSEVFPDESVDWWSGSNADGSVHNDTCNGWTSDSGSDYGQCGDIEYADNDWIIGDLETCDDHDDQIVICIGWN